MFNSTIAWFEIVTQDFERACQFYNQAFDITFEKQTVDQMQMAIFPYADGQVGGALVKSPCYDSIKSHNGPTVIYLNCTAIGAQLEKIIAAGGQVFFPTLEICHGFIAGFEDSEGNHIGLWSKNP